MGSTLRLLSVIAILGIVSCGQGNVERPMMLRMSTDSAVDKGQIWVDPTLPLKFKIEFAKLLPLLPPEERQNVLLVFTPKDYKTNAQPASQTVLVYHRGPGKSVQYEAPDGERMIPPFDMQKPRNPPLLQLQKFFNQHPEKRSQLLDAQLTTASCGATSRVRTSRTGSSSTFYPLQYQICAAFDLGTGPFRGVRATNGFTYEALTVTPPCSARKFQISKDGTDLETGYIYLGGWGASGNGVAVDAGLQANSQQAPSYWGQREYAAIMKYGGADVVTFGDRFLCGRPIRLAFFPLTSRYLVLTASGAVSVGSDDQPVVENLTMVQVTATHDGWTPTGTDTGDGIILKRMISIAQPSCWFRKPYCTPRFQDGRDGSYFGTRNAPVTWSDFSLGRIDGHGNIHTAQWMTTKASYEGVALSWTVPDSKVVVVDQNGGKESVYINEPPH